MRKELGISLRDITMDDLPMYGRSLTEPVMLAHLGGTPPKQDLSEKLRGIVNDVGKGTVWFSVIVPDGEAGLGAGSVCIWAHEWNGETISEMGWMVLPEFQGRGLATEAVLSMLRKAQEENRWEVIHAFPAVTNAPSNAICRKTGFERLEEVDVEGWGGTLRCNHWRIDLRSADA
jgi:RimJ/RimL family protein N-acetyltransferase